MKKEFKTILVMDWKNGKFKIYSRLPKNLKASEIPIRVNINVEIPEKPNLEIKGDIKLSDEKVNQMVIEEL